MRKDKLLEGQLPSTLAGFPVVLIEGETQAVAEQPGLFDVEDGGAR